MDRPWIEAGLKWGWVTPKDVPCLLVQRVSRLRGANGLSTGYLRYVIADRAFTDYIKPIVTGIAIPHISGSQIQSYSFRLPPGDVQRRIVSILSAYDDLIDNNLRRIKILEEMAQSLYREWFVDFRFPGHENAKMVDSPLGMIPRGWAMEPVGEKLEVLGGRTPSTKVESYFENGSINWYTPSDLTASASVFMQYSYRKITEEALRNSSAKRFPPFCVMMTSRATVGVVAINITEAATNQGFIVCVPSRELPFGYLYFWFTANVGMFESLASGATFKELRRGTFREIPILVPDDAVIRELEAVCEPLLGLVLAVQRKNACLRQTRDLLLPKLISGELDVSELDIGVGEDAA